MGIHNPNFYMQSTKITSNPLENTYLDKSFQMLEMSNRVNFACMNVRRPEYRGERGVRQEFYPLKKLSETSLTINIIIIMFSLLTLCIPVSLFVCLCLTSPYIIKDQVGRNLA